MCFYITTTLPKDTDIESIRTILDRYNIAFSPINKSNLISQLRPGELYFRATKDYCDCDTSLGILKYSLFVSLNCSETIVSWPKFLHTCIPSIDSTIAAFLLPIDFL